MPCKGVSATLIQGVYLLWSTSVFTSIRFLHPLALPGFVQVSVLFRVLFPVLRKPFSLSLAAPSSAPPSFPRHLFAIVASAYSLCQSTEQGTCILLG